MQVLSRGFYRIQISDVSSNDLICIFRRKRYKNGQSCKATWNCGYVRETITDFVPNNMTALSVKGKVASIVRGDHLTFEGGGGVMGDFRKYPADWFRAKKNLAWNACHTVTLYIREKMLSTEVLGKKFLRKPNHSCLPPSLPQKSNGRSVRL